MLTNAGRFILEKQYIKGRWKKGGRWEKGGKVGEGGGEGDIYILFVIKSKKV